MISFSNDKNTVRFSLLSLSSKCHFNQVSIMPVDFSGTWVSAKSEGWETILDAMKIDKSKFPADVKVTQTITQKGNDITIVTTNNKDPSARKEAKFTVGERFTDTTFGQPMEAHSAWEGNKLTFAGTDGKGKGWREIVGGQMLIVISYEDLSCKIWYDKQ